MKNYLFLLSTLLIISCNLGYSDADQLFVSSREGDLAKVQQLLAGGVDVNHRFLHRQRDFEPYETALIVAAEKGHLEIVKALVKAGADLEIFNTYSNETALLKAVKYKHPKVISYLLEQGAEPRVTDSPHNTSPLMYAIIQNNFKLIKQLRKYGAFPEHDVKTTRLIKGEVGRDTISIAKALKRPYVSYLKKLQRHCDIVFRTKTTCATKIIKKYKKKNKAVDF